MVVGDRLVGLLDRGDLLSQALDLGFEFQPVALAFQSLLLGLVARLGRLLVLPSDPFQLAEGRGLDLRGLRQRLRRESEAGGRLLPLGIGAH